MIKSKVVSIGARLTRLVIESAVTDQNLAPPSDIFETELGRASLIGKQTITITA